MYYHADTYNILTFGCRSVYDPVSGKIKNPRDSAIVLAITLKTHNITNAEKSGKQPLLHGHIRDIGPIHFKPQYILCPVSHQCLPERRPTMSVLFVMSQKVYLPCRYYRLVFFLWCCYSHRHIVICVLHAPL